MDYSTYSQYAESSSGGTGTSIFSLIVSVLAIVALWFLFVKANEPGWMSIVPFLNVWKEFEIVYGAGWKCLLLLVPILNIAVIVMLPFRMAQAFGKGILYGFILLIFPNVGLLMLAFGNATYRGPCYSFL